ncbi:MAG: pseudouridine synthase, partial [Pseudomonadales bacterium]
AITHYRPLAQFGEHTQVELSLETGRTHQIRVHMQYLGHPIIGDATYGGGFKMPRNKRPDLIARLDSMPRQALHARRLSLAHPKDTRRVSFESDLPADMVALLDCLAAKS